MSAFNPNDPNIAMLDQVAHSLGNLCERVVFIGGAAAGLLITDMGMPSVRRTDDVDVIAPIQALEEYYQLEVQLRQRGFVPDLRPHAPVCRWIVEDITVDLMPTREEVLGFANQWYGLAVSTAQVLRLPSGLKIKVVRVPEFVATKLEAKATPATA